MVSQDSAKGFRDLNGLFSQHTIHCLKGKSAYKKHIKTGIYESEKIRVAIFEQRDNRIKGATKKQCPYKWGLQTSSGH